jgi:hypothetical protein
MGGTSTTGGGAASATVHDEGEKKKIPPWQLGVIGVGLLLAVGIGVRSMMPAASSDGSELVMPGPGMEDPAMPGPASGPAPAPTPAPGNSNSGSSVTPTEAPYKIIVPPNIRQSIATMAIVPNDNQVSGGQAASYAAYVRRQLPGEGKRWNTIYIYVFADEKTAETFANFMRQRRGAPLSGSDYAALSNLWSSTLARYEYSRNGKEKVLYPSKNPSGWWYGNS